jgi:hypothetical protein
MTALARTADVPLPSLPWGELVVMLLAFALLAAAG